MFHSPRSASHSIGFTLLHWTKLFFTPLRFTLLNFSLLHYPTHTCHRLRQSHRPGSLRHSHKNENKEKKNLHFAFETTDVFTKKNLTKGKLTYFCPFSLHSHPRTTKLQQDNTVSLKKCLKIENINGKSEKKPTNPDGEMRRNEDENESSPAAASRRKRSELKSIVFIPYITFRHRFPEADGRLSPEQSKKSL